MKTFQNLVLVIFLTMTLNGLAQDVALLGAKPAGSAAMSESANTPFLFDQYYVGSITGKGGQVVDGVAYRFNTVANHFGIQTCRFAFCYRLRSFGFYLNHRYRIVFVQKGLSIDRSVE